MPVEPFGKAQLRKTLLAQRLSLDEPLWQYQSLQICQHLQQSPAFQRSQVILTYWSLKQEPDLSSLIQQYPEKIWGLPRCQGPDLHWHRWVWGDPREQGTYGIWEPLPTAPRIVPTEVDLIWVPAIACDHQFYRLGYGGGYFDRLFAQPAWSAIHRVGIIFEHAYVAQIPTDPWDTRLHAICSEAGYRT
jgi:5-formyltetrahydrofolate cyclo-ligase